MKKKYEKEGKRICWKVVVVRNEGGGWGEVEKKIEDCKREKDEGGEGME